MLYFLVIVLSSPTTPSSDLLRVTVTSSETDEQNATFKVVTKVRNFYKTTVACKGVSLTACPHRTLHP